MNGRASVTIRMVNIIIAAANSKTGDNPFKAIRTCFRVSFDSIDDSPVILNTVKNSTCFLVGIKINVDFLSPFSQLQLQPNF